MSNGLHWGFGEARHALWEGDRLVLDSRRDMGLSSGDAKRIAAMLNEHAAQVTTIERLRSVLSPLVNEVDELLEELDPCGMDCSKFHNLSIDLLPAARAALKEPT